MFPPLLRRTAHSVYPVPLNGRCDVHRGDGDKTAEALEGEDFGKSLVVEVEVAEKGVAVDTSIAQVFAVPGPAKPGLHRADTYSCGCLGRQVRRRKGEDLFVLATLEAAGAAAAMGADADQSHGRSAAPPAHLLHAHQVDSIDFVHGHGASSTPRLCRS